MHNLRNKIGCVQLEDSNGYDLKYDNLAIMLCTYFNDHPDCPEDQCIDDEYGWKPWVIEQTNRMLDAICKTVNNERLS
jgi:hypothetical protein